MEEHQETRYVKRTQKDYSMYFKLQIVQEIERAQLTVTESTKTYGIQNTTTAVNWLKKFGNFDWEIQTPFTMSQSPEQKIMELEAKVKILEKQRSFL
jgi:transposase-like protein